MSSDPARAAYEALAPIYDEFNHLNDYEMWFGALLPELEKRGLEKGRLLDIGCGTGRACEFELVWALNDVINYLLEDDDIERAFVGMRANLASTGLVLFDTNTIGVIESSFTRGDNEGMSVGEWRWVGLADAAVPGTVHEARISGAGVETHVHCERHYTAEQIEAAMDAAGLRLLAALGQQEGDGGVLLVDPPDESRDHKIIYLGCRADA